MRQPTCLLKSDNFKRIILSILLLLLILPAHQSGYSQNTNPQNAQDLAALELRKPIERELAGGQKHSYQIKLKGGQYAKIVIEPRGVDVAVQLVEADGNLIINFDSELRPQERKEVELVAEQAGSYHLNVKAKYKMAAGGRYDIRLTEVRNATSQDRLTHEARFHSTRVSVLYDEEKFDEAQKLAENAVAASEKALGADNVYVADLLNKLGYVQRRKGDYAAAEATLQRALAINEKTLGSEHPQTVDSLGFLGLVYISKNDNAKAERFLQQALETTEKTFGSEHSRVAAILLDLSNLYRSKGDNELIERHVLRALAIAEKVLGPDDPMTGNALNNLGTVYLYKRDYERARVFYERSLAIDEKIGATQTLSYSYTLQNLGIVYREKKDYARALELYGRSLEIREKLLGAEHPNIPPLLNNIANIYRAKGDYLKALEIQHRVLEIAEKSLGVYHGITLQSLGNIAKIYAAQGDISNAVGFQTRVDKTIERLLTLDLAVGSERQKRAYFDSLAERTDRTISLHADLAPDNQTASALAALVILQRKGRVLDAMSESFTALRQRFNSEDQKLLDQLNSITAQLAKFALNKPPRMTSDEYRKQFAALEEQKEKLEAEISRRSAEFRAQSQTVTLPAVQAEIPPNAALIEFAVYRPFDPKAESNNEAYGEPHYIAYIMRQKGEVRWKRLGAAREVDASLDVFRQALRDPKRKNVQQLSRAVDEKVMQPVRELLGDATQLLISPDGELNLMPFEALVDEQNRYLVERFSFTYLTSGRDLLQMQVARAGKNKPLVIANPSFGELSAEQIAKISTKTTGGKKRQSITATRDLSDTYFAPLGGTRQEAISIQTLFPEAVFLTEAQATETALKQTASPRILHIATHGFFLQDIKSANDNSRAATGGNNAKIENPLLRSGLALAGANQRDRTSGDDGILTALEASGLNLWGTKLVVLSACDTGLGEIRNGEGVYGLRRAFVLAGTESLVMSLWSVSDYVTRELMTSYYKNLQQGAGRGAALRQVKLEMLKKNGRQHPFYWASFIQSGKWVNLDGKR